MNRRRSTSIALLGTAVVIGGLALNSLNSGSAFQSITHIDPEHVALVTARGIPLGPEYAEVTIVEFTDFECSFCASAADSIDGLMEDFAPRVSLLVRHLPLAEIHPNAWRAAVAAECYHRQGGFGEFRRLAHAMIRTESELSLERLTDIPPQDEVSLAQCIADEDPAALIRSDIELARELGLRGTPTFIVGDRIFGGPADFSNLRAHVIAVLQP